ncbi:prepilin-type N-terminal cleavage/methylation domain-containing protein [Phragmitibacter flavus]|uniref:Prepilin-type N-terminal cleavage/methylation domain-containing protein n=1 Tax=Phragmitibacter flavus TaxID=2576071 RepID=A0A5R8KG87_9BACT|nr:prepilin-type N-terminal cleavage/methylation domain-containing protein [Phragmitibacter flavus]TLD71314.1 prepilin-type N-terminal cleavage/methylation domain-containing protein [Phragmitibacter flavus]
MKHAILWHREGRRQGFTLMEVLLALFVFVVAVMGLVECINHIGLASAETRLERRVQSRLDSLLVEATRRSPWINQGRVDDSKLETVVEEDNVRYEIKAAPLEIKTDDGNSVRGLYHVSVTGSWLEDGRPHESTVETWVWPNLFERQR